MKKVILFLMLVFAMGFAMNGSLQAETAVAKVQTGLAKKEAQAARAAKRAEAKAARKAKKADLNAQKEVAKA